VIKTTNTKLKYICVYTYIFCSYTDVEIQLYSYAKQDGKEENITKY